ncbi:MAG: PAS domain S-box protein [Terriglobia bacterium]
MKKKPSGKTIPKVNKRATAKSPPSPRIGRSWISTLRELTLVVNAQGRILEVYPHNPDPTKMNARRILGRTLQEVLPLTQIDSIMGHLRRSLKKRTTIEAEYLFPLGDRETWFSVVVSPITKGSATWRARDITDLKTAQEAARAAEERSRSFFEEAMIGLYQSTPEGKVLRANPALIRMLGYESLQQLLEADIEKSLYVDPSVRRRNLEKLHKTGRLTDAEFELRKRDGGRITVSEHARAITESGGKVLSYEGTLIDITASKRVHETLVESEQRFRTMADSAPVLIWLSDAEGLCTFFNQGWLDFTGRTLSQILGNGWTRDVHTEDLPRCLQTYWTAFKARQPFKMEYRLRRFDGEYRWILDSGVPRLDADGSFLGFLGSGTDTTELKRTTEALKHSEEKYRDFFDKSPVGIYRSSLAEGRVLDCNQAVLKMFGVQDLKGRRTVDTYLNPDDRGRMKAQILRHGAVENFETQLKRANGSPFWASISANLREDEGILEGVITDITEHKQAERALRESEDRYRDLVEHSHDLICTHDLEGRILSANEAATKVLGYTQNEVVGKNIRDFLPPESQPEFDAFLAAIKNRGVVHGFMRAQTHSGETRIWEYYSTIRTEGVEAPVVRGMAHDITERKKAERRLRKINECFLRFGIDPIENINRLTALCGELLGATSALYNRLDHGMLCSWGQWSTPPDFKPEDKPEGHICFDIIKQGRDEVKVVRHLDETPYAETDPNVRAFGLKTYVGRTVFVAGETAGSLCVVYQKDYVPSEDDKRVMSVLASAIGVEEMRRQSRLELDNTNETLRALIQGSPLAINSLDRYGKVLLWNPAAEKLFGWTEREVLGKPNPCIPKAEEAEHLQMLKKVIGGHSFTGMETQRVKKDGSLVDVSASAAPLRDVAGVVRAGLGIFEDNTERIRAECERQVIFQISAGVNQTSNLDELLRLIHHSLSRVVSAENCFIALYKKDEDILEFPFFIDQYDPPPVPMKGAKTATAYVLRTGKPLLLTEKNFRQLEEQGEVDLYGTPCPAWLGVPLNTPIGTIGVLVVQHYKDPHAYHQRDLEFLASVGNQIALAIERKRTEDALRQSEERYRAFVRQSSEGIWRFEAQSPVPVHLPIDEQIELFFQNGYLAECNDVMAQLYGFSAAQEMIGTRIGDLLPRSDERNVETLRQFIRSGYRLSEAETLELTREGDPRNFLNNLVGIIEQGSLVRVWGTQRDITAQKQAEEALRESEERYRRLVEFSPEAIVVHCEGKFVFINSAAMRLFGANRTMDLIGTPILNRVHPDHRGVVEARLGTLLEFKERVPLIEERFLRLDGTVIDVEVTAIPFVYRNKPAAQVAIRDITARKRAEESERRLLRAVEQTDEVIFMTGLDGTITYVNPAFEKVYGFAPAQAIGQNPRIIKSGLLTPQYYEQFWKTLLSGKSVRGVMTNRRKDGELVTVESSVNPVVNPQGTMIGFISVQEDVTERKLLETQLRQAQKMEAVGRLAGGVAHDFNNLLTAITGYSDLMLMRLPLGDPLRRHAEEIKKASDRAASLTQQLLAFSRKQVLQPKLLDLNAVVADMDRMLRRLIGEDIELVTLRAEHLGKTKVDPGQVAQVLMNLAVNARDAMPKGGKLTIETSNEDIDEAYASRNAGMHVGSYVVLGVRDTGTGMDSEIQKHLFEPFFTTKEMGKGTGLGLSTVYGIVKQSGGYIWVNSEVGSGTTFKVYLPRHEEVGKPLQISPEQTTPMHGSETILVVEDEDGVRDLVRDILEMNGYTVLEASAGEEALERCRQHPETIHLILTDVVMPQMSGRELAERLVPMKPGIKVLYMSGYTDDTVLHHGALEADMVFLQKPFTPEALARRVREVLDAGSQSSKQSG